MIFLQSSEQQPRRYLSGSLKTYSSTRQMHKLFGNRHSPVTRIGASTIFINFVWQWLLISWHWMWTRDVNRLLFIWLSNFLSLMFLFSKNRLSLLKIALGDDNQFARHYADLCLAISIQDWLWLVDGWTTMHIQCHSCHMISLLKMINSDIN